MEFRDKLLSSEIRHVTELVNMLSYELVILQDFLKEEYGVRYSRFRNRHALATLGNVDHRASVRPIRKATESVKTDVPQTSSNPDLPPAPTTFPAGNQSDVGEQSGAEQAEVHDQLEDQLTADDIAPNLDASIDIVNEKFDPDFIFEGDEDVEDGFCSDSSSNAKDNTWQATDHTGQRGRYRLKIWEKFDKQKLPNGKVVVKCRKCRSEVSAVPKRLERHYEKCTLGVVRPCSSSTSTTGYAPRTRGNRPKGSVWTHFNQETTPEGKPNITCKYCSTKVSNHSTRMARHLQNCLLCPIGVQSNAESSMDASSTDL